MMFLSTEPSKKKISAVVDTPEPKNVNDLRSFWGIIMYMLSEILNHEKDVVAIIFFRWIVAVGVFCGSFNFRFAS